MADRLGDPTARLAGRLTLNPLKHIDPVGSIIVPFITSLFGFTFGWAKPVPYNPYNLKNKPPRRASDRSRRSGIQSFAGIDIRHDPAIHCRWHHRPSHSRRMDAVLQYRFNHCHHQYRPGHFQSHPTASSRWFQDPFLDPAQSIWQFPHDARTLRASLRAHRRLLPLAIRSASHPVGVPALHRGRDVKLYFFN